MKRIISVLLSMMLCMTLIPCVTFAEGAEKPFTDIPLDWEGEYDGFSNDVVVRRDYEIHIELIGEDGTIEGRAIISPSEKTDAKYGANGSYLFSGTINMETYEINLQGNRWVDYPVSEDEIDNWQFIELNGTIDMEKKTISGTSEHGIWEMKAIDYNNHSGASGFKLGRDNNNFVHTASENWDGAGFKNVKKTTLDSSYFNTLTKNASREEKSTVKKNMDAEWGGSCYGIASTMALTYEGYLNVRSICSDDVSSYHDMRYPADDRKLLNTINYYQLSQYISYNDTKYASTTLNSNFFYKLANCDFKDVSLSAFLKELVGMASDDKIIILGVSSKEGGHEILVTGCRYDKETKQFILTVYDENSVDSSTDIGNFTNMYIAKDYSKFKLEMAQEVVDNDSYTAIDFLDTTKMLDLQGNMFIYSLYSLSDYTTIIFPADHDLTITDDCGYILQNEGGVLSGDMYIYDFQIIESGGTSNYLIRTDNNYPYTLTGISGGVDVDIYNYNGYMAVKGSNIESAYIYPGYSMTLSGDNYDFKAYSSTENEVAENEYGLVSVSGKTHSETRFHVDYDTLEMNADSDVDDVETATLIGVDVTGEKQASPVSTLRVNSADGKAEKDTNNEEDPGTDNNSEKSDSEYVGMVDLIHRSVFYNGKAQENMKVYDYNTKKKLTKDVDYTIKWYTDHKSIGTHQFFVSFIGKYKDTPPIFMDFKILPAKTKVKSVKRSKYYKKNSIVYIKKSGGGVNYTLAYRKKGSRTWKHSKVKKYYMEEEPKLKKGRIVIHYDKSVATATIKNLKKSKKYQFKVRAFKKVNGKTYYGKWSKVKTVKIK